jgi:YfiH family protein
VKPEIYIIPDWPCAPRVKSAITTRHGGVSRGNYAGFNLADHVGDDPRAVGENRETLRTDLGLPQEPCWLQQVHGARIVNAASPPQDLESDGSFAMEPGVVCAVMTADCLPILLTDKQGTRVAALHAGWRGLAAGIIEQGVDALDTSPEHLLAYLGPAIGPEAFEVGTEVRETFCDHDPNAANAFRAADPGKWMADIYRLAHQRLNARGLKHVYGGGRCTFSEEEDFFSYRRDDTCGRMASLIWIQDAD